MFTNTIDSIEIELANKCNARCPQCPRYDNNHRLIPGLNKNEITLETFKKIDVDIIQNLKKLDFKGTTGDPIIAKDLIPILEYTKNINNKCQINLATNGGLHNTTFWQKLAELTIPGSITFGIDGLSGIHEMYRIGTNFNTVIDNAKTFINAGGTALWQMLIFEHNEHQIDCCKSQSKELGFAEFSTMYSDRFAYVDSTHVTNKDILKFANKDKSYTLKPTQFKYDTAEDKITQRDKVKKVSCLSLNTNSIFIYADGSVWPCCMLGGMTYWGKESPHSQIELSMIKKHVGEQGNINNDTLSNILQSQEWDNWSWVTQGHMPTCRLYCGVYN